MRCKEVGQLVDLKPPLLCMKGSSKFVPLIRMYLYPSQSHTFTSPVVLFVQLERQLTFNQMGTQCKGNAKAALTACNMVMIQQNLGYWGCDVQLTFLQLTFFAHLHGSYIPVLVMTSLTLLLYFQVVYVIEHDFSNAYIQEHLQLAFDNVQVIKVENPSSDELIKKRMRKKKLVRTGEQVSLSLSFPCFY